MTQRATRNPGSRTQANKSAPDDRKTRANVFLLAACQALAGANITVTATLGGVIGVFLAQDKTLATLPITAMVSAAAIATMPASLYMRKVGRRVGFMTGAVIGTTGAIVVVLALIQANFWMVCAGTFMLGINHAFAQYFRFAAADTASAAFRPKAISLVLAGGVLAAVLGPQIVIYAKDLLAPVQFAGAYAALAGLGVLSFAILSFIDIPMPADEIHDTQPRPLSRILRQRQVVIAIFCALVSYAMMNLVMTATPLAMLGHRHGVDDAAFIIQWHVVAMFAPSFFTGNLISRFGSMNMIMTGLSLMVGCAIAAQMGTELTYYWIALVMLGLGWNFSFIAATNLLTSCYRSSERNKVQGANDLMVFGSVAVASVASGALFQIFGWTTVLGVMMAITVFALLLVAVWRYRPRGPGLSAPKES